MHYRMFTLSTKRGISLLEIYQNLHHIIRKISWFAIMSSNTGLVSATVAVIAAIRAD